MSHEIKTPSGNRVWGLLLADREDEIEEADILAIEAEAAAPSERPDVPLDEPNATPPPWEYRQVADAFLYGEGDFPPSPANIALAVKAVNLLARSEPSAAGLDVPLYHEALYSVKGVTVHDFCGCESVAAEYARLTAAEPAPDGPEQG